MKSMFEPLLEVSLPAGTHYCSNGSFPSAARERALLAQGVSLLPLNTTETVGMEYRSLQGLTLIGHESKYIPSVPTLTVILGRGGACA